MAVEFRVFVFLGPEDDGSIFSRNVDVHLPDYNAYPRRPQDGLIKKFQWIIQVIKL
jgi:hypothetical protein